MPPDNENPHADGHWEPDWCVHPGELLLEELDERGWRQADLVAMTGFTAKHINQVIKGKAHIGPAFAIALSEAFGTSAQLWMNLQAMWDIATERARQRGIA